MSSKREQFLPFITKEIKDEFDNILSASPAFNEVERMIILRFSDNNGTLLYPIQIWRNLEADISDEENKEWEKKTLQRVEVLRNHQATSTLGFVKERITSISNSANASYHHLVSVSLDNQFDGLIGFEKKRRAAWSEKEIHALDTIAITIVRKIMEIPETPDFRDVNWIISEIMDKMNSAIFISDLFTDEILFANDLIKKQYNNEELEGNPCWKVLRKNKTKRCDMCPKNYLMQSDEEFPDYQWEDYNEVYDHFEQNHDGLMRWFDGRIVHYQVANDVTEARRLYRAATYDDLTKTYTRSKLNELIQLSLIEAFNRTYQFTVCMFDLNDLKYINDTYGHLEGDNYIQNVTKIISNKLGKDDYIGRLSGDEFIVVFINQDGKHCEKIMEESLIELRKNSIVTDFYHPCDFCYGYLQINEGDYYTLRDVLRLCDEKMYFEKKKYHIERATIAAKNYNENNVDDYFEYDESLLYDALAKSSENYLYVCNLLTGTFLYTKEMVDDFNLPGRVLHNASAVWSDLVHPEDKQHFLEANQEILDGRANSHVIEYRAKNAKGEWVWLRCRGTVVKNNKGENAIFAGFIMNIGKQSKIDLTTGLYNKYEFEDLCINLFEKKEPFTIMMLDIDDFKNINALNNRTFGDKIIKDIGQILLGQLSNNQYLYRLDGDEFGIVSCGSNIDVEQLYTRIQKAIQNSKRFGNAIHITISCGYAVAHQDSDNYLDLAKYAEYALSEAKVNGKNSIRHYNVEVLKRRSRKLLLTQALHESIKNDFEGFSLLLQPVVDKHLELVGAESLSRFHCDLLGDISPEEFVPILEENNMINEFGNFIFTSSLQVVKKIQETNPKFRIGINLSPTQLVNTSFPEYVKECLVKYEVDPHTVIIELTESMVAKSYEDLTTILNQLRSQSIKIAMDDFGTGYSSLGLLKNSPFDIVKIDKTFVTGISENVFDRGFIKLVVDLCKLLNIYTLIEGIETEEEYEAIKDFGITLYQGFLFSKPVEASDFLSQYEIHIKKHPIK